MFATAEVFQEIMTRLSVLRYVITSNAKRGKYDIAIDAEDFFAGFLNILMHWQLINLNYESPNHPAVDLGDRRNKLAIQVTAQNSLAKIKETIDLFYTHKLDLEYCKLIILILSTKKHDNEDVAHLKRGLDVLEIWDLDVIFGIVEKELKMDFDRYLCQSLDEYTRNELPSIVRALSKGDGGESAGLLRELEVVGGHPPTTGAAFIKFLHPGKIDDSEASNILNDLVRIYNELKDRTYTGSRSILSHAVRYSITADEFSWRFPYYHDEFIGEGRLIYSTTTIAQAIPYPLRQEYFEQVTSLQFLGWARPLENLGNFLSVHISSGSLDGNFLYFLRGFLNNDANKLVAVLVDLDFRHLD